MRVVGGELRGRRLASPPRRSQGVRPTSDRAREAIFSILGEVGHARVLDLFAGTGALAIEALSRGAAVATLVDSDTRLAERNVRGLGLEGRAELVRDDVRRFLGRVEGDYDLVFCDPPYRLADRLEGELAQLIPPRVAEGGRVIVESSADRPLDVGLPLLTERRYGEALVRVHRGMQREGGE